VTTSRQVGEDDFHCTGHDQLSKIEFVL
jgi:hypothetical protein